jgi:acyl-coenzyme A thioesterase PaaI-like protein
MQIKPPLDYPSEAARLELAKEWNKHPGMEHLGVRVDLSQQGEVRVDIDPIQPFHRGGLGTDAVNGAIISGVFDLVSGLAGYLHTLGKKAGVAQLSIQFLRPVLGDRFHVVGRPNRVGRNLVFTSAELLDDHGVVCARCDGIVSVSGVEQSTSGLAL